jgi:hypothetical protein
MKHFLLSFFPILFTLSVFAQADEGRISTQMTGKIEDWEVTFLKDQGNFEGYLMNDVNRWTFEVGALSGEVNSEFNDQYNSWEITAGDKSYHLKTWISASWNKWELSGGDLKEKVTIQTLYNGAWDNWTMTRDSVEVDVSTYYNNSYDDWNIKGDLTKITDGEKVAAMFIPIFVSRIYKRNLVH